MPTLFQFESFIDKSKWGQVNLVFASLFQYLHKSRGDTGYGIVADAAKKVGPQATTMLQLFESTKRLIHAEVLKKQIAAIGASLSSEYKEALLVE
jgi:hypothetical protein